MKQDLLKRGCLLPTLEIKRTSITRLKPCIMERRARKGFAWNQKNLDYEIETNTVKNFVYTEIQLEIKRTSITRLKPAKELRDVSQKYSLKSKEPRLRDWNGRQTAFASKKCCDLEIKRTSITRLKRVAISHWMQRQQLEIKRTSITRLKRRVV